MKFGLSILLSILTGFIFGSIPFAYLVARLKGVNIKTAGSKNIGATNVFRLVGTGYGIAVFILDASKGFVPTLLALRFGLIPALVGGFAILGHIFSPFMGFKGGKGVSTTYGVLLAMAPVSFLAGMIIWLFIVLISSYASVASITFAVLMPALIGLAMVLKLREGRWQTLLFTLIIAVIIIIAHRGNITRLMKGEEPKFRWHKG
jgi:glycerol-3-phosphate acyltransferase PlsY